MTIRKLSTQQGAKLYRSLGRPNPTYLLQIFLVCWNCCFYQVETLCITTVAIIVISISTEKWCYQSSLHLSCILNLRFIFHIHLVPSHQRFFNEMLGFKTRTSNRIFSLFGKKLEWFILHEYDFFILFL
jgi:hypothetical protein